MPSCDPSELAQAARCFDSCTKGRIGEAIKSYLICAIDAKYVASEPEFVRASSAGATGSVNTITLAAFNATGGDYLVVGLTWRNGILRNVTSITANGVAMTLIDSTSATETSGRVQMYGLANPTSGNITVTWDGNIQQGIALSACLFSGVTGIGTPVHDFDFGFIGSLSVRPTSVFSDLVVDVCSFAAQPSVTVHPAAGQTLVALQDNKGNLQDCGMSIKGGGRVTTTMTWLADDPEGMAIIAVALHGA